MHRISLFTSFYLLHHNILFYFNKFIYEYLFNKLVWECFKNLIYIKKKYDWSCIKFINQRDIVFYITLFTRVKNIPIQSMRNYIGEIWFSPYRSPIVRMPQYKDNVLKSVIWKKSVKVSQSLFPFCIIYNLAFRWNVEIIRRYVPSFPAPRVWSCVGPVPMCTLGVSKLWRFQSKSCSGSCSHQQRSGLSKSQLVGADAFASYHRLSTKDIALTRIKYEGKKKKGSTCS